MAEFTYSNKKFNPNDIVALLQAIKQAAENHDYDSGWIATPATKILTHALGVVPKEIHVYKSASPDGSGMAGDTFTAADSTTVTITGPLAYCRALVNK